MEAANSRKEQDQARQIDNLKEANRQLERDLESVKAQRSQLQTEVHQVRSSLRETTRRSADQVKELMDAILGACSGLICTPAEGYRTTGEATTDLNRLRNLANRLQARLQEEADAKTGTTQRLAQTGKLAIQALGLRSDTTSPQQVHNAIQDLGHRAENLKGKVDRLRSVVQNLRNVIQDYEQSTDHNLRQIGKVTLDVLNLDPDKTAPSQVRQALDLHRKNREGLRKSLEDTVVLVTRRNAQIRDLKAQIQNLEGQAAIVRSDRHPASFPDLTLVHDALNGTRGTDQERLAVTAIGITATLLKKNRDYGSSVWKTPILAPHVDAGTGILIRLTDKVERVHQLLKSRKAEVAESLEDTMKDLAGYAVLYLARPEDRTQSTTSTFQDLVKPIRPSDPSFQEYLAKTVEQVNESLAIPAHLAAEGPEGEDGPWADGWEDRSQGPQSDQFPILRTTPAQRDSYERKECDG